MHRYKVTQAARAQHIVHFYSLLSIISILLTLRPFPPTDAALTKSSASSTTPVV